MENAIEQFKLLLRNPVLLSSIFGWFSAQFVKTLIQLFSKKVHSFKDLMELLILRTGGMPSSHSAFVTALCTSIGFKSGINSDVFLLSFGFLFVTVRDAFGVRRATGIQAGVLNKIGKELSDKEIMEYTPIKEVQGHSPTEVLIGCLLGFFIAVAFSFANFN